MSFLGNVAPRLEAPSEVQREQELEIERARKEEEQYLEEERVAIEAQIKKEQAAVGPQNDNAFLEVAATPGVSTEEVVQKDPIFVRIEQILEKDLGEEFKKDLNDQQKARFTRDGEILATRIFTERAKIAAHKRQPGTVVRWIRHWLLELPGVSKVFLDQLSKNKTDALLKAVQAENQPSA